MTHPVQHTFASQAEANAAVEAFYKGVTELREKHGIAQVLVGILINVDYPTGFGQGQSLLRLGDQFHDLPLAAYLYGECDAAQRMMINQLAAGGEKAKHAGGRKPKGKMFDKDEA